MDTFYGVLLIFMGIVNANLIRVGIETGKVQFRMLDITKEKSNSKFWLVIFLQMLVSAVFVALGLFKLGGA